MKPIKLPIDDRAYLSADLNEDGNVELKVGRLLPSTDGCGKPLGDSWRYDHLRTMTTEQFIKFAEQINRIVKLVVLA